MSATIRMFAWGALPHSQIVDAALTAIPAEDQITLRLGSEVPRLRNTVEMGDWINSLIVVNENWQVTTENFPLVNSEYFGNDYLLFPEATHSFEHMMPSVAETYRPFFLRALQALRTEDAANASRWIGSLLHFVTDSGSPPHAIGLRGPNHTRMENWLDASKIDLAGYQPVLLGHTDEEALAGLQARMKQLVARNGAIAKRMVPYAEANDRAHVEPLAFDCATETAKVTADVLHTLLVLTAHPSDANSAALFASVSAPALQENRLLPAKLVLLGTDYSTLSETAFVTPTGYEGSFTLTHLPPGTYRAAIERPGSETLFTPEFKLVKGQSASFNWILASAQENMVQNADFRLHWVRPDVPDHWHFDAGTHSWLSDNIPVIAGHRYQATGEPRDRSAQPIDVEWMSQHWKTTDDPSIALPPSGSQQHTELIAPASAKYLRFVIPGSQESFPAVHQISLVPTS